MLIKARFCLKYLNTTIAFRIKFNLQQVIQRLSQTISCTLSLTSFFTSFLRFSQSLWVAPYTNCYCIYIYPVFRFPSLVKIQVLENKKGCTCPLACHDIHTYSLNVKWMAEWRPPGDRLTSYVTLFCYVLSLMKALEQLIWWMLITREWWLIQDILLLRLKQTMSSFVMQS